jgi:tight adherence protein C
MTFWIALGLFLLLMAFISVYGYRRYARPARIYQQLGAPVESVVLRPNAAAEPEQEPVAPTVQLLERIGGMIPVSPADSGIAKKSLVMAGYRNENALKVFYGIKAVMAGGLFLFMLLFRDHFTANPVMRIVLLIFGAVAGYCLPGILLDRRIRKRQDTIRLSLPDALDLMVVSVEAGLGLDQAIQYVSRELQLTHRDVSDELGLVNLEMRAGKRRAEALRNLADRTGEAEIKKLVAILIQNDRFGTSMAESLRQHSDFMRTRRRQEAEERAGKVGVKLVFPIFFFILPSMMVVAAGPALIQIFKYLFPMMKNFGN